MKLSTLVITIALTTTALSTSLIGILLYKNHRDNYLAGANFVYKGSEVLGISTDQVAATVDFSKEERTGSPLVFGGAHNPRMEDTKAWDEIQNAGITAIRADFYLDRFLPQKISLAQYKQNVNDVQNPAKWNQAEIKKVREIYQEAHKRNLKSMGIMAYSISWLSASQNNYGVPTDWSVYEDIAAKSYTLFRPDIDSIEIWNEPDLDFFLNTKNSGLTKEEAYYQIVSHAVSAIRSVDKSINDGRRMKIGIGIVSQPMNSKMLTKILSDKTLAKEIDFVSYHNYEHLPEPSDGPIRQVLSQSSVPNLPIFLTEWAHTPNIKQSDIAVLSTEAIPYTGAKLIDFLNMGLAGANYFTLQPIAPNSPRGDEGLLGYYKVNGKSVSMLPVIKTWTLMSKTMGLGAGESKIFKQRADAEKVLAFQNSKGNYGLVLSNESSDLKEFNFSLYGLPFDGDMYLTAYVSSAEKNGKEKLGSTVLTNRSSGSNLKVVAPANSVVGVFIEKATLLNKLPL